MTEARAAGDAEGLSHFADSTDLLDDVARLRARFDEDGYVYLRGVVDTEVTRRTRAAIVDVLRRHEWLDDANPIDAVPRVEPRVEGEDLFFRAYDDIQRLEALHAVPHEPSIAACMRALLGPTAFPHPLGIARLSFPDNDDWATPPHQDFPNNQGTTDLYACWVPLGSCPIDLGSLAVLRGSHRFGVLPLEFALGAGHRQAKLDERLDGLEWVGGDFADGDVLIFHSLTVHRALPNLSDRMRLSVDYRFQREGDALTAGCLEPHFNRLTWDEIYAGWERDDIKYYWRQKRFAITDWDPTFHAIPDDEVDEGIRESIRWRWRHRRIDVDGAG